MNKFVSEDFATMRQYANDYQKAVRAALLSFRRAEADAKAEASRYKAEQEEYSTRRQAAVKKARSEIKRALNGFQTLGEQTLNSLREALEEHYYSIPDNQFTEALRFYKEFGLVPEGAGLTRLLAMSKGCPLALSAINKTLEGCGSNTRIKCPEFADYEADLENIQKLVSGSVIGYPTDLHPEAVAVFGGTPMVYTRSDGSTYENGTVYDSTSLLLSRTDAENILNGIEEAGKRWAGKIPPSIVNLEDYKKESEDPEGDLLKDQIEAGLNAEVDEHPGGEGVELARQLGKAQSDAAAHRAGTLERYG